MIVRGETSISGAGEMDEARLIRRILAGHSEACDDLAQLWIPALFTLCYSQTGKFEVAEVLAQEVFEQGLVELLSLSNPERFVSWLAQRATQACRSWLEKYTPSANIASSQKQGCETPSVEEAEHNRPADQTGQANQAGQADQAGQVEGKDQADKEKLNLRCLFALPEESRLVLLLRYLANLELSRIGLLLDLSVAVVQTRLAGARALLRAVLPSTQLS